MADERALVDVRRVEHVAQPVGERLDARAAPGRRSGRGRAGRPRARCSRGARSSATAAPTRCGRCAAPWMKTTRRLRRVERLAAGVGVGRACRRRRASCGRAAFPRRIQRARSGRRSGRRGSSRPIDRRIVPSVMPARCESPRRPCGSASSTPDGSPATWRRRRWPGARRACSASMKRAPCVARRPCRSKLNTAPQPRGSRRCASAWSGCVRQLRIADRLDHRMRRAGTRRPCACSRRAAPCAAAASRCPAGSGTRSCGAMQAPKSRRPSRRARSRKAPTVDSSANTMS